MPRYNSRNHVSTKRADPEGTTSDVAQGIHTIVLHSGPTTSGTSVYTVKGNSLYNVISGGGTSQRMPSGVAEKTLNYRNWRVLASRIRVNYLSSSVASASQPRITVLPTGLSTSGQPGGSATLTAREAMMNPYATSSDPRMTIDGAMQNVVTNYMSTKKYLGCSDVRDMEAVHGRHVHGGVGVASITPNVPFTSYSEPAANYMWHWMILLTPMAGGATSFDGDIEVEVTYYAEHFGWLYHDPPSVWDE